MVIRDRKVIQPEDPQTHLLPHSHAKATQGPSADPQSGPTNHLTGPNSIVEQITVSPDGKTFTGTFTIMDYAETDTPQGSSISWLDTLTGTVTGTRIGVNTPVSPIFRGGHSSGSPAPSLRATRDEGFFGAVIERLRFAASEER